MLVQERDEFRAVARFDQVQHLMHDHVFQQVLGLLQQLGVEPNVSEAMITSRYR